MSCQIYNKFQLGKVSQEEFDDHKQTCTVCQTLYRQDKKLFSSLQSLKKPQETGELWGKIEYLLQREMEQPQPAHKDRKTLTLALPSQPLLKAAVFLIGLCLVTLLFLFVPQKRSSGLLSRQALQKVEKTEQAYIAAIRDLEEQADSSLASMDIELSLLYRDRLSTIDEQIRLCKEELEKNPANTHIRRYLLAALQDKKETLREITTLKENHG
jgi:hypothetical protein